MRFASVAEIKDGLSEYLARAKKKKEPIVVTHHGKPYALIQPIEEGGACRGRRCLGETPFDGRSQRAATTSVSGWVRLQMYQKVSKPNSGSGGDGPTKRAFSGSKRAPVA